MLPKLKAPVEALASHVNQYHALATFHEKSGEFSYKVWDVDGRPLSRATEYLACGLNGAGDVMNCSCADGFTPTGLGKIDRGRFIMLEKTTMNFAQFTIPENLREPISRAVECTKNTRPSPKPTPATR